MSRVGWAIVAFNLLWTVPSSADPVLLDAVLARVNGQPITLSSLRPRLRQLERQLAGAPSLKRAVEVGPARRALLERAIDERLIAARARQLSVDVGEAEIDAAIAGLARQNGIPVDELLALAVGAGLGERDYRDEVRRQLLEQRVALRDIERSRTAWPEDPEQRARWFEERRKAMLTRLRRQAWIERRARW